MTAPAVQLSPLGRAAVGYAENGWAVFPLAARRKEPLLRGPGGYLLATTDVEQVRAWWTQNPYANIGLAPGRSGICVIDVDGPNGEAAAQGLGVFAEPTLVCTTGRPEGGRHLYFRRPDFVVGNADLAPNLEVRCDAGFVVVPPSVHPTGTVYAWHGKASEIRALPDRLRDTLARVQTRERAQLQTGTDTPMRASARAIALEPDIPEGGRNNALTRYAGVWLAKGMTAEETHVILQAVNATKCKPPLPPQEVTAIVANIAHRESLKVRTTDTGTTLALVGTAPNLNLGLAPTASGEDAPTPAQLAAEQVEGAKALLTRDVSLAPRWAWHDFDVLSGPMMPGELIVVGAATGNGKSTLLMSQMDAFAEAETPTLYVPLEIDAEVCRLRWAAWKLGLSATEVIRQEWHKLAPGAQDAIASMLDEQERSPYVQFPPPKRVTLPELAKWCRWGVEHFGARVVMLDHLHRMDFGADAMAYRVTVTEVARRLKDLARELGIVLIAAAQLNRSSDPIDAMTPPAVGRLKESAGISEEADAIYMLSRALKRQLPAKWTQMLRLRQIDENDLSEPGVMLVTCRKHRLDDSSLNRSIRLQVVNGKLTNAARAWHTPPRDAQHDEPRDWRAWERDND